MYYAGKKEPVFNYMSLIFRGRRCDIEISYGTRVEDKNGKYMGTVSNVMRDSWTGNISKFGVSTDLSEAPLFYSTEDVSEVTDRLVKLKIAADESSDSIQFGSKVIDMNGKLIGTIDYLVNDPITGKIKKFKVNVESGADDLIFSVEDVDRITPDEVRLKSSQIVH